METSPRTMAGGDLVLRRGSILSHISAFSTRCYRARNSIQRENISRDGSLNCVGLRVKQFTTRMIGEREPRPRGADTRSGLWIIRRVETDVWLDINKDWDELLSRNGIMEHFKRCSMERGAKADFLCGQHPSYRKRITSLAVPFQNKE